jgi:mRNA-degrading endonuclease RelE of RelBE toxin-antitoxin system
MMADVDGTAARRLIYGNYLIVYAIQEAEKQIVVLRFLHSSRVA